MFSEVRQMRQSRLSAAPRVFGGPAKGTAPPRSIPGDFLLKLSPGIAVLLMGPFWDCSGDDLHVTINPFALPIKDGDPVLTAGALEAFDGLSKKLTQAVQLFSTLLSEKMSYFIISLYISEKPCFGRLIS